MAAKGRSWLGELWRPLAALLLWVLGMVPLIAAPPLLPSLAETRVGGVTAFPVDGIPAAPLYPSDLHRVCGPPLEEVASGSPVAANRGVGYTVRGDARGLEQVTQAGGFQARGSSTDLMAHALDNTRPPSAFVSTSTSVDVATDFATNYGTRSGTIFTVRPQGGIDVNRVLGSRSPFPHEQEIAIPGGIRVQDIRGATPVNADGSFVGHSVLNPAYGR